MARYPIPVLTFFLLANAAAPAAGGGPLSYRLQELAGSAGCPGVLVGVVQEGRLTLAQGFGRVSDAGDALPDAGTRFEIGSLSKAMTAQVLLRLRERGVVALEDTLGRWLGDDAGRWSGVTLDRLLTHTAGIPDYETAAGYGLYAAPAGLEDVLAAIADLPPEFAPGESFRYSNTGYYLLSVALERASGKRFARLLEDEVFAPLGMTHSSLGFRAREERAASGYEEVDGGFEPRPDMEPSASLGAGGVVTTLEDLARWEAAMTAPPAAWLSRGSLDLAWTPAVLDGGSTVAYGFGWILGEDRGIPRILHAGRTAGFSALYWRYPGRRAAIIVLGNAHRARLDALARAASLEFVRELRYDEIPVPRDPDPDRTALLAEALRQAVLGEGGLDLLHDGMRDFAVQDVYGPLRESLAPYVRGATAFEFLRATRKPAATGGAQEQCLYRLTAPAGVQYVTLVLRDGRLGALNWEDN